MLTELILAVAPVAALVAAVSVARMRARRHPSLLMWQWGRFINHRPGIKNDAERIARLKQMGHLSAEAHFGGWEDEPDIVDFVDYRYWLRLKPNFGFNFPLIGYWSHRRGHKKLPRSWE